MGGKGRGDGDAGGGMGSGSGIGIRWGARDGAGVLGVMPCAMRRLLTGGLLPLPLSAPLPRLMTHGNKLSSRRRGTRSPRARLDSWAHHRTASAGMCCQAGRAGGIRTIWGLLESGGYTGLGLINGAAEPLSPSRPNAHNWLSHSRQLRGHHDGHCPWHRCKGLAHYRHALMHGCVIHALMARTPVTHHTARSHKPSLRCPFAPAAADPPSVIHVPRAASPARLLTVSLAAAWPSG